jgi:ubiquinone/menaquinone biosynthesis C-methylase UbiE
MIERAEELTTAWAYKHAVPSESQGLVLLDNVQFIYELALAELELQALGAEFKITNGLRKFDLLKVDDERQLLKRLAYFRSVNGTETDYFKILQYNRTNSVNQYLTHWIYPYKGKFHPQMVRALLNYLGLREGETVLDPFMGSGTTALEAQLLGINCIGIDASPLCVLQTKVKTESIGALDEIKQVDGTVPRRAPSPLYGEQDDLTGAIKSIQNEKARNFFEMAKLVSVSDSARRHRDFYKSFSENLQAMIQSVEDYVTVRNKLGLTLGCVDIREGDVRNLPIQDESVDGILTSPPYSIALDYVENDKHSLKELGCDVENMRERLIGVRGPPRDRIGLYEQDMRKSIAEMYRVLRNGRSVAIVIGNATYGGAEVETVLFTVKEAEKAGFKLMNDIDKIIFGLYNVMRKESILVFQK